MEVVARREALPTSMVNTTTTVTTTTIAVMAVMTANRILKNPFIFLCVCF